MVDRLYWVRYSNGAVSEQPITYEQLVQLLYGSSGVVAACLVGTQQWRPAKAFLPPKRMSSVSLKVLFGIGGCLVLLAVATTMFSNLQASQKCQGVVAKVRAELAKGATGDGQLSKKVGVLELVNQGRTPCQGIESEDFLKHVADCYEELGWTLDKDNCSRKCHGSRDFQRHLARRRTRFIVTTLRPSLRSHQ